MSRPITPISGAGPTIASGHSRPTSYIAADNTGIDRADQAPEYLGTEELGRGDAPPLQRSGSQMSQSATYIPSRGGTLKKKASLHKTGSLKRNGSKKSSYAGSVRSMKLGEKDKYEPAEYNSAFYCPIPTNSSPTELLANRFQAWRKVLKDLINYFRELHKSHELRTKAMLAASNMINNTTMPTDLLSSGGVGEAAEIMREFYKQAHNEANKSRELENDVIMQLTGLRSDLSQKIKEIKSLSGDFKNSVHKEQDGTRKAVNAFQEALGLVDLDAEAAAGKGDPFLMKLGVERQLERQIEEENYLHRAYLNLEASGRELESIVVGEIQKAYNVLAGILKRDADGGYDTAEKLREGPLAMARDHEWDAFVTGNSNMVDPREPLRQVKNITYEGKDHPAAVEVKSGMLERKSKYLKNYSPGWYILSPTHLHEFKSADQIPFQAPVMSLFLPEQKLGSHSELGSSSHKFMVKGRQTGSMHRGHTWIFRAETHDTMMAWFTDIRELTEKRGEARNEFVRRTHARSVSRSSQRAASIGSGDSQMAEDEADKVAFSSEQSVRGVPLDQTKEGAALGAGGLVGSGTLTDDARSDAGWRPPQRPQPGGRFPSDVNVTRGLQAPLSPSSEHSSDEPDRDIIAAAATLPGSNPPFFATAHDRASVEQVKPVQKEQPELVISSYTAPIGYTAPTGYTAGEHPRVAANPSGVEVTPETQSQYHEWVETTGAGLAGAGIGAVGATAAIRAGEPRHSPENTEQTTATAESASLTQDHSSAPIIAPSISTQASAYDTTQPATITTPNAYDEPEPKRITASAYQATTIPSATATTTSLTSTIDEPGFNGNLIGGTDVRAPIGAGLYNAPAKTQLPTSTHTPPRPSPVHTKSVQTISDLHIPGEFPKSAA